MLIFLLPDKFIIFLKPISRIAIKLLKIDFYVCFVFDFIVETTAYIYRITTEKDYDHNDGYFFRNTLSSVEGTIQL
jgi:hypothetical protein